MPARRSIAVTASRSARSSSSWRASVQRFSCRRETERLTGSCLRGQLFEDTGELSGAGQERRHRHQRAQVDGHQGRRTRGGDWDREPAQRMTDQHNVLALWNGLDDKVRILAGAGVRILGRKVDRAGRMSVPLELDAKAVPAPGAVIGAVDQGEVHARRLVDALQNDDRDLARGLLAVVVKGGVDVRVLRVEALVLVAVG